MISVLLIDEHELVRSGIESLLNSVENISVVCVADSCEEVISVVEKYAPDVVLMDVNMPGIGGFEACRRLLQRYSEIKIIALSVRNDGPVPMQLLKLGAQGFLSKTSSVDELVKAIRYVVEGRRYICPDVASNIAIAALPGNHGSPFEKLSLREIQVVALILQGKTIKEMSESLILSDKTINTYRYRVYKKLHIKNDVELTRLAVKYNYIDTSLI